MFAIDSGTTISVATTTTTATATSSFSLTTQWLLLQQSP